MTNVKKESKKQKETKLFDYPSFTKMIGSTERKDIIRKLIYILDKYHNVKFTEDIDPHMIYKLANAAYQFNIIDSLFHASISNKNPVDARMDREIIRRMRMEKLGINKVY